MTLGMDTRLLALALSQGQATDDDVMPHLGMLQGDALGQAMQLFEGVKKKPALDDLQSELSRLETLFGLRNEAVEANRELVYQEDASTRKAIKGKDRMAGDNRPWDVLLSIPETIIRGFKSRLSQAEPQIQVSSYQMTKAGERHADKIEALIRRFRSQTEKYWRAAGHPGGFQETMFEHTGVTGMLYELLVPDEQCKPIPVRAELLDPLTVFPVWGHGGIDRCYIKREMTTEEARRCYGEGMCPGKEGHEPVCVTAFYSATWIAVIVDNDWGMPPESNVLGFVPILVTFVHGRHGLATTKGDADVQEAEKGRGMMTHLRNDFENGAALLSMAMAVSEKAANPGAVFNRSKTPGMAAPPGSVPSAGEVVAVENDEKLEPDYPQGMPVLQNMLAYYMGNIREATGYDPAKGESGYAFNAMTLQQENTMFGPYMEAIESHLTREAEMLLRLYRQCGCPAPVTDLSANDKNVLIPMEPEMVPEDVEVEVKLVRVTQPQRLMMLQQLLSGVGKVFGPKTALDWLGDPNPDVTLLGLNEWMVQQNPMVQQSLTPIHQFEVAFQQAQDRGGRGMPESAQLYQMAAMLAFVQAQKMMEQAMQQVMQPQPPQPQMPMGPPQGGPPGGMPPDIPPELLALLAAQGGSPMGPPPSDSLPPPEVLPPAAASPMAGDPLMQEMAGQGPALGGM